VLHTGLYGINKASVGPGIFQRIMRYPTWLLLEGQLSYLRSRMLNRLQI